MFQKLLLGAALLVAVAACTQQTVTTDPQDAESVAVINSLARLGNPNNATIDSIMQSLIDDGTIGKLGAKYLAAAWGKDPASIPYLTP